MNLGPLSSSTPAGGATPNLGGLGSLLSQGTAIFQQGLDALKGGAQGAGGLEGLRGAIKGFVDQLSGLAKQAGADSQDGQALGDMGMQLMEGLQKLLGGIKPGDANATTTPNGAQPPSPFNFQIPGL